MPLPAVLQEGLQPVAHEHGPHVAATAAGQPLREIARYSTEAQAQSEWCWAAVACSIAKFYDDATKWNRQCVVADAALERSDCCQDEVPPDANQRWSLHLVLELTGNLRHWAQGTKRFDDLAREIDEEHPLAARIEWTGGGAHFVVVSGYDAELHMLLVKDPFYGDSTVTARAFDSAYHGTGSWTHSYETQPAPHQPRHRAVRS